MPKKNISSSTKTLQEQIAHHERMLARMKPVEREPLAPVPVIEWQHCYDKTWSGMLVPEAYAHPAKASRALLEKIYDYLYAETETGEHAIVVDPFGGIGTTAIIGAYKHANVVCCELEPKFVKLAERNFQRHEHNWLSMDLPLPLIVQGDSRNLRDHIRDGIDILVAPKRRPAYADVIISSPPYADQQTKAPDSSEPEKKIKRLTAEGKHREAEAIRVHSSGDASNLRQTGYGESDGQLSALPSGAVDAVISSPPYETISTGAGGLNTKPAKPGQQGGRSPLASSQDTDPRYGSTDGQLARPTHGTFWSAARDVIAETYAVLRPGGYAVWIVKHFVRHKELVDFPGDWRRVCEHVGYTTLTEVHAMLVSQTSERSLFGEDIVSKTERKSFFRRLAEAKGSPAIDFETVYIMRKV